MSQKGAYLLNAWNIDDANRVLRLIQDRISSLNATTATTAPAVSAAALAGVSVAGGGGASGSIKTIYVVFTDPGGGIIINNVGRGSLTPTTVLGP